VTRRLSLTIFLAVLGSLAVFALAVAIAWWWNAEAREAAFEQRLARELAVEILPAAAEGSGQLRRALERWHRRARMDLTVLDAQGEVVAWAGRRLVDGGGREGDDADRARRGASPDAQAGGDRGMRRRSERRLWTFEVAMPDGRVLLARPHRVRPGPRPVSLPLALGLLMLAGAVVAWPVSRRITRRLEKLQAGVDRQGSGDLSVRVAVEGKDEVAALARSFNASAGRIEELVRGQEALLASQKRLLANASHELRSPLARIRMATELLLTQPPDQEQLADELRRNIGELDQLVDEILLASRLETSQPAREEVDLAGLAAEEASRIGAEVTVAEGQGAASGAAMTIDGDSRLLRRLLRNLLENARRHGGSASGEPVQVAISRSGQGTVTGAGVIVLEVLDRGAGVPADARERIFDPFYRVEGHSEQAGGVGLGLSLVKQIAEAHGGSVRCEGREGGGSRFILRLPVLARQEPTSPPAARAATGFTS
jgi:two-component system, OmpR family, sensor kinase